MLLNGRNEQRAHRGAVSAAPVLLTSAAACNEEQCSAQLLSLTGTCSLRQRMPSEKNHKLMLHHLFIKPTPSLDFHLRKPVLCTMKAKVSE
jgi:hypothetical protein